MHWSPASPSQRSRRQRKLTGWPRPPARSSGSSLVLKNDPAAELVSDSRYRPSASCRPTRRSRTVPEVLPTTMRSPRRTSCFRRGDHDIAVAIDRIELVAVDLDREGGAVDDAGRVEAAPGAAHRLAVLVEAALGREPRQRHHRDRLAGRAAASQLAALEGGAFAGAGRAGQLHEAGKALAGDGQDLGDRFGRGPAWATLARDALAGIEGGGVKARPPRQTGCRKAMLGSQSIDPAPHVRMLEHGNETGRCTLVSAGRSTGLPSMPLFNISPLPTSRAKAALRWLIGPMPLQSSGNVLPSNLKIFSAEV